MDFVHEPSGDQLFNEIKRITVDLRDLVFHLQVELSLCVWTDGRRDVSSGLFLGGAPQPRPLVCKSQRQQRGFEAPIPSVSDTATRFPLGSAVCLHEH